MVRIDTSETAQKWRFTCPGRGRHSSWRVVDGLIECRACGETYRALWDQREERRVPREEIELVGPHADSKGQFGEPTVE